MSHLSGRSLSEMANVFNKQLKTTEQNCCSMNIFTACCKCLNCSRKTEGQHKMKRLMTRKERSQMRGGGKAASKTKSHHHHWCQQSSKDMAYFHNCCHSSCYCPSRRAAPIPNVVPTTQELSIITDSRLIGHHGLFNHEVKSVDIERLLTEQGKLEIKQQHVQERNHTISRPSSTHLITSPVSPDDLLGADANTVVTVERKAGSAIKAQNNCWEKEKKINQESDITLAQRPQQELDLSSGSYKSIFSSKHSPLDKVIFKSEKTNSVKSEKDRVSQLSPTIDRGNVNSLKKTATLEHTPKNQESSVEQTQAHGLSPSPLQLPHSLTADSFDIQHRRQDPHCVSKAVSAVAARLCDSLHFPFLRRHNLETESREMLLKALQDRHGPRLQENLLKVQQCLSFGTDPAKIDQDQEPAMIDEDELLSTAFQVDTERQPCFDMQQAKSFGIAGSTHFDWKSTLQPHQSLEKTAEWSMSPLDAAANFLDDTLRPSGSPQFCLDFELSGASVSDHLFAPSATPCWGEKTSASQCWEDSFNRTESKESIMFDSFESSFMNHTKAVRKKSYGPQYSDSNIQPSFLYKAQLPHRHSAEPVRFTRKQDPFETDKYLFASSFSPQICHHNQINHFQPFSHFSHPPTYPPIRAHHTDMMQYPPSYMLERDPPPHLSSFPSPEHWSFPPMRLY
uniref:proline-rich protein 19 n=1 Tax=Monopterus albus TaxID=43700 RepID=UPI0009B48007|nr:uncharacterized protein LOC109954626 [Monopterus albus]